MGRRRTVLTRKQALVKVDWDHKRQPNLDRMRILLQRAEYRIEWASMNVSPSGNGWHVVFSLRPYPKSPHEVVALQLLLGGDVWRESIQLIRARAFINVPVWMRDRWNVLYQHHPYRCRYIKLEPL